MKQENTFLLRRWRDKAEDSWHFSLKDIHSGEVKFFISSTPLFSFLLEPLINLDTPNKTGKDSS